MRTTTKKKRQIVRLIQKYWIDAEPESARESKQSTHACQFEREKANKLAERIMALR